MDDVAVCSGELGLGNAPLLGSSGNQHGAGASAGLAQVVPVLRDGQRTAGELRAIHGGIDLGLFNLHIGPGSIEFFGEDDTEGGLDALTDLRVLGVQRDLAVWRDAHIGTRRKRNLRRCALSRSLIGQADGQRQHQTTAHTTGQLHEAATTEGLGSSCLNGLRQQALELGDHSVMLRVAVDDRAHAAPPLPAVAAAAAWMALRIRT